VKVDYKRFSLPITINKACVILAMLGVLRTLVSISLGIRFHGGVWFLWDLGVMFAMIWFPIFLALFPAMIVDYACKKWRIQISSDVILGFFFYLQVVHLLIPFLEFLQRSYHIPCFIPLIPSGSYLVVAISPLALTPLIFLVTNACTLGITSAWMISTITTIRFGKVNQIPMGRFLFLLMGIFYVIYVITYPTYLLFYSHGNNFFYGMTYLLGSLGPYMYFKTQMIE
jgi:hypothetical protein